MVYQHRNIMTLMYVFTHTYNIPFPTQQAAGNLPEELIKDCGACSEQSEESPSLLRLCLATAKIAPRNDILMVFQRFLKMFFSKGLLLSYFFISGFYPVRKSPIYGGDGINKILIPYKKGLGLKPSPF